MFGSSEAALAKVGGSVDSEHELRLECFVLNGKVVSIDANRARFAKASGQYSAHALRITTDDQRPSFGPLALST